MSIQYPKTNNNSKQDGMVAIMVTLILMIVISLIVLGFAQISRRNQRQTLDRQLSTQAFYAAESGINDAAKRIKEAIASGETVETKNDCAPASSGQYAFLPSSTINAVDDVKYTCLIVDPTLPELGYNSIGKIGTIVPLTAESGTISAVTLTWKATDGSLTPASNCPTGKTGVFTDALTTPPPAWTCSYGVFRFDLVPTAGNTLGLATLQSNTMTSFIVPLRPGSSGADSGTMSYAGGGANNLRGILCTQTSCSLTINFASPQSQYHMRVSSLYKDVSLTITAVNGSGGAVSFVGAQVLVDATGKAHDVLRRIQVRMPLSGSSANLTSDYAIQSGEALCKRFSVMDGFFQSDANNAVPGAGDDVIPADDNPLCN